MSHVQGPPRRRLRRALLAFALLALGSHALAQDPTDREAVPVPPPITQEPKQEDLHPPLPEPPKEEPPAPQGPTLPQAERPKVVAIHVDGEQRYSEQQLALALGQQIGAPIDPARIDSGVRQLWTSFHVRAEVLAREVPGGVELMLTVHELPVDREPRFVGNAEIKSDTLKRWALIEDQTELFLHQARRVRQRLLEGYAREGYYFVEINVVSRGGEENPSESLADVIFEIREGPKVRVTGVELRGNTSMPDTRFLYFFRGGLSHLAKRQLEGKGLLNWKGSVFTQEALDADLLAMRNVYRDRGWLDAVVEIERLEFNADRDRVTIHVGIDEGPIYHVRSLTVHAFEWRHPDQLRDVDLDPAELYFPEEQLLGLCTLKVGATLEKNAQKRDEAELRTFYGKHGYLSHDSLPRRLNWQFLEPSFVFDPEQREVDVTYRVVQGKKLTIREISFAGAHHTRDRVLRRELSVFPGQQASLDQIQKSLARISGTGYFDDPFDQLEHRQPTYRFLPVEDEPTSVDLQYEVDEGRVVDFQIQGGVDSNQGAFGLVSLTMRNFDITDLPSSFWGSFSEIYHKEAFHGAGQRLDLEVSPGTEVTRFRLHFLEPDLFQRHLEPISLDFDLQKRLRTYETHDEDRFERRIKFGRKLSHDVGWWLGYVNTDLSVDDLDSGGVPPSLTAQEALGDTTLSGVTLDYTRRKLDHPVVPQQGYDMRVNNVLYAEEIGSDFDILDSEVRYDWYKPIGERPDGTQMVLHAGVDAGVAIPYGDTDEVPYTERFFLGGANQLRGFDFRGVGPVDPASGFALGGETMVAGTVEWRIPLHSTLQPGTYKRIETLRGLVFMDWGVLDPDSGTLDFAELRATVGFGIGLAYPLPLILNFGYPIRSQDGDQTQVFSFSLGLR